MMEPAFEMLTTSSVAGEKDTTPEAAFIAWSELATYTETENVLPTVRESVEGEKPSVAAKALLGNVKNSPRTERYIKFKIIFFSIIF